MDLAAQPRQGVRVDEGGVSDVWRRNATCPLWLLIDRRTFVASVQECSASMRALQPWLATWRPNVPYQPRSLFAVGLEAEYADRAEGHMSLKYVLMSPTPFASRPRTCEATSVDGGGNRMCYRRNGHEERP